MLLFFFLWQSFTSALLVYSVVVLKKKLFLLMSVLMKNSMPPFQAIFWNILSDLNNTSFLLFVFVHKYPTFMILSFVVSEFYWGWFLCLPFVNFISFMSSFSSKSMIWVITSGDSVWMLIACTAYLNMFLWYVMVNFMTLTCLLLMLKEVVSSLNYCSTEALFIFLIMSGLPPGVFFLLKWMLVATMSLMSSWLLMLTSLSILVLLWLFVYTKISVMGNLSLKVSPVLALILSLQVVLWLMFL